MRKLVPGLALALIFCTTLLSAPRASADEPRTMQLEQSERMLGQLVWLKSVTPCDGVGGDSWGAVSFVISQGGQQWVPADVPGSLDGSWNLQQWLTLGWGTFDEVLPNPGPVTIAATCHLVVATDPAQAKTTTQFDYDPVILDITPALSAPTLSGSAVGGQLFRVTSTAGCPSGSDAAARPSADAVHKVTIQLFRPGTYGQFAEPDGGFWGNSRADGTFDLTSTNTLPSEGSEGTYDLHVVCEASRLGDDGYLYPAVKVAVTATSTVPVEPAPTTKSPAFVALGDSYSSGEGNSPYRTGSATTLNACHRSDLAYGPQMANGYPGFPAKLGAPTLVACSGATTEDLFSPNHAQNLTFSSAAGRLVVEPGQLESLGADTRLVTLTIGGDDAGFADVLAKCVVVDLGDPKCRESAEANKAEQAIKVLAGETRYQHAGRHSYAEVLKAIHGRAKKAKILIGAYPRLVNTSKSTMKLGYCSVGAMNYFGDVYGLKVYVYRKDGEWLNAQSDAINKAMKEAVDTSGVKEARFVPARGFKYHELCTKKPYLFKTSGHISAEAPPKIVDTDPSSFHPNPAGQSEYRKAFLKKLK